MNLSDYIKNHPVLQQMDFLTVYKTIQALIADGYIIQKID